ncbi:MAG: CinA family protein [Oxalobacter sp.]|nr:CinA family protein [Oxalobacter sp.]
MTDIFQLATRLGNELLRKKETLVTAESCTGGGIAQAITDIPGSSQWFDCGWVTYSNLSKTSMLHVSETLIRQYGAVSGEVVSAMAKGALQAANGSIAIATTGIAGPDGATPAKPVGTVWFGLAANNWIHTERQCFSGDRQTVREKSVEHALMLLLEFIETGQIKSTSGTAD